MTDFKEKYDELLENYKALEKELLTLKLKSETDKGNSDSGDKGIRKNTIREIFDTISSYLSLFSVTDDNRIIIIDINLRAEETEHVSKNDVAGKYVDDTPLKDRTKLVELIHLVNNTGDPHKLTASANGDDSEGYYMGFTLTTGNILITWEPGDLQKKLDDIYKQNVVFEKFADMLPEMVYEVDLNGKVLYGNAKGLKFFGYDKEDLAKGTYIWEIFPESYETMISNLRALTSPDQVTSNEYTGRKKDGTLVPILTHSFALFHNDKIVAYRGVVSDISKHKQYEEQIRREKPFSKFW